ncbi:hypothetical protein PCANC_23673 [Puccinia coronata f. sp. avenae]|uniref:Uncharacterized protein n=1 Tax=Puccinia coronata f. sp. avenae TaxID=200324 RepID=A0A2N5TTP1_9BASI|nr:hypothetical protein PCANC_23817 [Puccinia coronata f. sp. avenae]PLW28876.1 hypothetical protein PCANC_23673 [Puccinia coronata f. sp. avenae]
MRRYKMAKLKTEDCAYPSSPPPVKLIKPFKPDICMLKLMEAPTDVCMLRLMEAPSKKHMRKLMEKELGELTDELGAVIKSIIKQSGVEPRKFCSRIQLMEGDLGTYTLFEKKEPQPVTLKKAFSASL